MSPMQSRTMLVDPSSDFDEIDERELTFQQRKVAIHEKLVDSLDLSMLAHIPQEQLAEEVRSVAAEITAEEWPDISADERDRLLEELYDEVFGLGPLEPLMRDDSVSDILVNHPHEIFVERRGRLESAGVIFADEPHLIRIIQRIVSRVGRRIDEVSPMVDARLADGSRINAVIPPLALDGPSLSIRRFGRNPLQIEDLIECHSIPQDIVEFLAAAIDARVSFLISGGTGAGKTTLLNALTKFIPVDERLVTVEDSAELQLQHRHVVRLETRPPNNEGAGEITPRALVRNSLRMRPDRIIIGEVRGAEALDMLQAMNTGHEGSLTTIHANDTRDALARLELMVAMSGFELPIPVVRQYITSGISLVVHLSRLKGGVRRVMQISEIVGVREGGFHLEDVFGFEQTGVDELGVAQGEFFFTGYRPMCLSQLRAAGLRLPDEMFDKRRVPVGV
ncbi:MAG: CpaF family protein [Planctomycetota bacterium]|nr:MAG: CpaF family protein [Planctomycetota bacterium]REK22818.1 MAG: CpaF family protein [Planctomycetota bacterium]REK31583.1 MAG: CpaF family protein [Planctomycetota bacterium]